MDLDGALDQGWSQDSGLDSDRGCRTRVPSSWAVDELLRTWRACSPQNLRATQGTYEYSYLITYSTDPRTGEAAGEIRLRYIRDKRNKPFPRGHNIKYDDGTRREETSLSSEGRCPPSGPLVPRTLTRCNSDSAAPSLQQTRGILAACTLPQPPISLFSLPRRAIECSCGTGASPVDLWPCPVELGVPELNRLANSTQHPPHCWLEHRALVDTPFPALFLARPLVVPAVAVSLLLRIHRSPSPFGPLPPTLT